MSLKAKIEAVLFCSAKPIKAQAMARIVNADVQAVRQALLELVHDYEERHGGLEIADEDGYSFQVKDEYANLMDEFLPVEMSAALIRTLSAVAIKQPIAQSEIIRVRGAGAYDHIKELVIRELVSKKEEQGGRSPMLTTTKKFQEYFRLTKDGKELRNFLKGAVKKAAAAADAEAAGQMLIPDVVTSPETDSQLNNRIFLETAAMADAAEEAAAMEQEIVPAAEAVAESDTPAGTEDIAAPVAEVAEESGLTPAGTAEDVVEAPVVTEASVVEAAVAEESGLPPAAIQEVPAMVEIEINAAPESELDVPPPPTVGTKKKARRTLSKLAEAADVKQPEPLPGVEPVQEPVKAVEQSTKSSDEARAITPPPAAAPAKGSVQARAIKDGTPIASGNGDKKKPPILADILKKQKDLERVFQRGQKEEDVQQTKIDFGNVIEPTPPADKAS